MCSGKITKIVLLELHPTTYILGGRRVKTPLYAGSLCSYVVVLVNSLEFNPGNYLT